MADNNTNSVNYDYDNLDKKPSKIKTELEKGKTIFIVIALLLLLAFALYRIDDIFVIVAKFFSIIAPILYGLAFAYLINPLMRFIERLIIKAFKDKVKKQATLDKVARGVAVFLAMAIIITLIAIVLNMMLPQLYRSIRSLIYVLPGQLDKFIDSLDAFAAKHAGVAGTDAINDVVNSIEKWVTNNLATSSATYMQTITESVSNVVGALFDIIIGLIIAVYVLISKEKFAGQCKKVMFATMKTDRANFTLSVLRKTDDIFSGFLIAKIIDSIIIGILCFIGMSIFNFTNRYTLLVSVFVGITNIIPFFGPYIGAVPSALLIMLENPIHGIYFVIFILVLQQLDGNVIGPKIMGSSTGLSAFWVIVAILLGGGLFGFVGMIIGVPLFAIIYYMVHMIIDEKLVSKQLPINSDEYINTARVNIATNTLQELPPIKDQTKEKPEKKDKFIEFVKKYSEKKKQTDDKGE